MQIRGHIWFVLQSRDVKNSGEKLDVIVSVAGTNP